jgi:hypothetical protein
MITLDYIYTTNIIPQVDKRTTIRLDWMKLYSNQLVETYLALRNENSNYIFEASVNSQVLSLEYYINSTLNPITPIELGEGKLINPVYISRRTEQFIKTRYVYTRAEATRAESPSNPAESPINPAYIYGRTETLEDRYDFQVIISASDIGLEDKVKTIVDEFKPAGKTYKITILS